MSNRAYTYIDRTRAQVGNRWIERTWSTFIGNTNALVQKDGGFEWLAGRSGEYRVEIEDDEFDVMDFGDTAWSEENSVQGATLVSTQRGAGMELVIRTLAFHDHPALVRTVTVRNLGGDPLPIREVLPERLPLRRDGLRVFTDDFSRGTTAADWHTDRPAAALALEDRGLFLGRQGGGHFTLFDPDPTECALRVPSPGLLGPGEIWRTAPIFLIPFTGGVADAAATVYASFLQRYLSQEQASPWTR